MGRLPAGSRFARAYSLSADWSGRYWDLNPGIWTASFVNELHQNRGMHD